MDKLDTKKIAIIGLGNMGKAIAEALLKGGIITSSQLILSASSKSNLEAAEKASWILIAVKPSIVREVIEQIKSVSKDKLILSVAAGVSISNIQKYSDNSRQKIIRLMPNIAVSCNQGLIGFYGNKHVTKEEKKIIKSILLSLGIVIEVKNEDELDKITVISGCGPAIVSYFIDMLSRSGQSLGLSKKLSHLIAKQTFSGTLSYLEKTHQTAEGLQKAVATKGGVTEEIIKLMEKHGLYSLFEKSVKGGYSKIKQLL